MHQMAEALHDETSENLQSTHNNPLTDSHEVSSVLSGVAVSNLSSMDMETYQSEVTGGLSSTPVQHFSKKGG
jgi:hypothetical protein